MLIASCFLSLPRSSNEMSAVYISWSRLTSSTVTHHHCRPTFLNMFLPLCHRTFTLLLCSSCHLPIPTQSRRFISTIFSTSLVLSVSAEDISRYHQCLDSMRGFLLLLLRTQVPRLQNLPVEPKHQRLLTRLNYEYHLNNKQLFLLHSLISSDWNATLWVICFCFVCKHWRKFDLQLV